MTVNTNNYMSLYTLATNNTRSSQRFNVESIQEEDTGIKQAQRKSSEEYQGFIDTSYNRAIGIPDNIHLSESIVNTVETFLQESDSGLDLEEVIRRSWDLFEKWAGKDVLEDQDGFINKKQYEQGIPGIIYLENGKVKTDNVASVKNMEHSGPWFHHAINAGAEVSDQGIDIVKEDFSDYTGGATYPGDTKEGEIAVGTVFNNFLKDLTVSFDPHGMGAPGILQSVLSAHGGDWLQNIQDNAQSYLDLLSTEELLEITNRFKLDVTA